VDEVTRGVRVERGALGRRVVRGVGGLEVLVTDDPDEAVAVLGDPPADDLEAVCAPERDDLLRPLARELVGAAGEEAVDPKLVAHHSRAYMSSSPLPPL
jgi:hypothetical protein